MENITPALLDWFYKNRRILPFREDPTPYHVWLSEVMLQQTRVSAVLPYYHRFLAQLPDIPALAACEEEKLHKLWEGLGYYSRVRNLQKAAEIVCEQYGGQLPADYAAYDTAFLFLGDRFDDANVPPWAMKVVLDEEEFAGPSARAASALAEALYDEDDPCRELNNT